jgi:DNA-binding PadR family transcriptional regulator
MQDKPSGDQAHKLFEVILLQSLDTKPMLENELTAFLAEIFGIVVNQRTIMESLDDLVLQGLIHFKVEEPDEPIQPFRLTSKGRNALTKAEGSLISTCKDMKSDV